MEGAVSLDPTICVWTISSREGIMDLVPFECPIEDWPRGSLRGAGRRVVAPGA